MKRKLKLKIQKFMWRLCGLQKLQDQIDTLHYFYDRTNDPSDFPDEEGNMRLLQEADIALLKVFDAACQKFGLCYRLAAGTLLGAVRHGGFIPWDDDQDVEMLREEYERAKEVLPAYLAKYGVDCYWNDAEVLKRICVTYQHEKTGVWLDVFPTDIGYYPEEGSVEERKAYFLKMVQTGEVLYGPENGKAYQFWCNHGVTVRYAVPLEAVFPMRKIAYKWGGEFSAPGQPEVVLEGHFGNWKGFPKSGMLHHNIGRGDLCDWHEKYGVDMCEVKAYLEEVAEKILADVREEQK